MAIQPGEFLHIVRMAKTDAIRRGFEIVAAGPVAAYQSYLYGFPVETARAMSTDQAALFEAEYHNAYAHARLANVRKRLKMSGS